MIQRAKQLYPDEPTLPAVRAQLALLLDDRQQAQEAIERSLSLDPDNSTALEARANLRADLNGDLDGAYADLTRAIQLAPGSTSAWNGLGLVQSSRGADREAEAALKHSIELDPPNPSHNQPGHGLPRPGSRGRGEGRDRQGDGRGPELRPRLCARGRYHLQKGDIQAALADLLAGTTANPAYAQGLLLLAAGYYMAGDRVCPSRRSTMPTASTPTTLSSPSFRTAVAIDDYEADPRSRTRRKHCADARTRRRLFGAERQPRYGIDPK